MANGASNNRRIGPPNPPINPGAGGNHPTPLQGAAGKGLQATSTAPTAEPSHNGTESYTSFSTTFKKIIETVKQINANEAEISNIAKKSNKRNQKDVSRALVRDSFKTFRQDSASFKKKNALLDATLTGQIKTCSENTTADNIIKYFTENTYDTDIAGEALKKLLQGLENSRDSICENLFEKLDGDTSNDVFVKLKPIATNYYNPLEHNEEYYGHF